MVLIDLGEIDEARPLLEDIVAETDHTFVSKRAEIELSSLSQQNAD